MKLDILAALNTNSRRLIRIWRSCGLVGSKNREQASKAAAAAGSAGGGRKNSGFVGFFSLFFYNDSLAETRLKTFR